MEEVGEVFNAVQSCRGAVRGWNVLEMGLGTEQNAVLLEVGDVLWYTVSLSLEVGSTLAMPEIWPARPIQTRLECLAALQCNEADRPEILMMACTA